MDRKYMKNYSDIILYCIDNYSEITTLQVSDLLNSDEILLKIEQIIRKKPSEHQFLKELEPFRREWMKRFDKTGRLGLLNNLLLYYLNPFRMRKIYKTKNEAYYVLTFKKSLGDSIVETARFMMNVIKRLLTGSEELIINDKSLSISGDGYRYSYQLEAYKRANQTVCFSDNDIRTELIYRTGVEEAISHLYKYCRKCAENKIGINYWQLINKKRKCVYERISTLIEHNSCSNPASEFVKILKQESKDF